MRVEDWRHCQRCSCNGTPLLHPIFGLFQEQALELVLVFTNVVGQVHHPKESHLLELPRGIFAFKPKSSPLLRVVLRFRLFSQSWRWLGGFFWVTRQMNAL